MLFATMLVGMAVTVKIAALPGIIVILTVSDIEPFEAYIFDTPTFSPFTVMLATPLFVVAVDVLSVSLSERLVENIMIVPSITLLPRLSFTVAVIVDIWESLATIGDGLTDTLMLAVFRTVGGYEEVEKLFSLL